MVDSEQLNWAPPIFPQGTILMYEVVIRNSSNSIIQRENTTGAMQSLSVNLAPGNYTIEVSFFLSLVESAVCMHCLCYGFSGTVLLSY